MAKLIYGGVEYRLVGASNSAKDGKFYFVDLAHSKQIAERFQHWPEAAMVYFAILVSDCKLMVDEPNFRVAVVQEHALGTNDCRGWVRESVYRKLKIGTNRFCQFRLAFDAHEPKQAKGALKAMSDRVADRLGVDLILPDSATKPALKGGLRFLPQLGTSAGCIQVQRFSGSRKSPGHWSLDRAIRWLSTLRRTAFNLRSCLGPSSRFAR